MTPRECRKLLEDPPRVSENKLVVMAPLELDRESDQMRIKAKRKQIASARKRVTTPGRLMTGNESFDLLESARQALAMVQGSKLIGGRISVR